MRILITGGTGFLGQILTESLLKKGHNIYLASRQKDSGHSPYPVTLVDWPLSAQFISTTLHEIEACIHLAGEPIAGARWSSAKKAKILSSRSQGTEDLVRALADAKNLKVFISASATGIYGNRNNETLDEASAPGGGFLADVCKTWESQALKLKNVRTVLLRTGLVLQRNFGALAELEPVFRNGLGSAIGSGKQYMSWIHSQDWVRAVEFIIENSSVSGAVNLTAPEPITNAEFSKALSALYDYSPRPKVPAFVIQTLLGEMAALVLEGQRVLPKVLTTHGFQFQFSKIVSALNELFGIPLGASAYDQLYSAVQFVNKPLEETFRFFENEKNLEILTPDFLNFKVLKKSTQKLASGTTIDYKLRIHGIPTHWQSQINDWNPPYLFSDTQLKGPYAKWYHRHSFEPFCSGTLMKDSVYYRLPMGLVGNLFGKPLVKKDIQNIFAFRKRKINNLFRK